MTIDELYERCQDEIFNIGEAIDYLEKVRGMKNIIDILYDRQNEVKVEAGFLEPKLTRIAQEERDELNRDYERGLL